MPAPADGRRHDCNSDVSLDRRAPSPLCTCRGEIPLRCAGPERKGRGVDSLTYTDGVYESPERRPGLLARAFPEVSLYGRFLWTVLKASRRAKRGRYDGEDWKASSLEVIRELEGVGVRLEIGGLGHLEQLEGPCVVIGNHMSTLETVVLPGVIQPVKPLTFVVKQSLLEMPVFHHVMRSRDPIAVTRTNPRQDLKAVLEGGAARLARGITIVVFPQTTRTPEFDPSQFSSIGAKLAHKAGVPIVPVALKTDAWGNGRHLKELGKVDPSKKVHIAFGEPLSVAGRGVEEHQAVIGFIEEKLAVWAAEDGAPMCP